MLLFLFGPFAAFAVLVAFLPWSGFLSAFLFLTSIFWWPVLLHRPRRRNDWIKLAPKSLPLRK